jgi:hypothetical protein
MNRHGTLRSITELEHAIYLWMANWNEEPRPFLWKATAEVIPGMIRCFKELQGRHVLYGILPTAGRASQRVDQIGLSGRDKWPWSHEFSILESVFRLGGVSLVPLIGKAPGSRRLTQQRVAIHSPARHHWTRPVPHRRSPT